MDFPAEFRAQDGDRVTRLSLSVCHCEPPEGMPHYLKMFRNLEEFAIIVADICPSDEDDVLFVDCTVAEALQRHSHWRPIREYLTAHPTGPPFYDYLATNLERYLTRQLESLTDRGEPGFKIPKFRYVNVTDAQGKRDLEAVRELYWGAREDLPSKEDWERFLSEDMDAKVVARPPSLFDLEYADDLEVDDEIFQEKLRQSADMADASYY
jgi:hypothetical protein